MIAFRLFIDPLPVWDYWYLLLVPLCLGVSIVYKAARVEKLSEIPKQSAIITTWIIGGMALAGVALAIIVKVL